MTAPTLFRFGSPHRVPTRAIAIRDVAVRRSRWWKRRRKARRGVSSEGERDRGSHGLGAARAAATVMLRGLTTVTTLRGSRQRDVVTLRAYDRRGTHRRGSMFRRRMPGDRVGLGRRLLWMIAVFVLFGMLGAR
jgi:hypothetical protein